MYWEGTHLQTLKGYTLLAMLALRRSVRALICNVFGELAFDKLFSATKCTVHWYIRAPYLMILYRIHVYYTCLSINRILMITLINT